MADDKSNTVGASGVNPGTPARVLRWAIVIIIILTGVGVAAYFFATRTLQEATPFDTIGGSYSSINTPFRVLMQSNPDFAAAEALDKQNNYQGALDAYQRALTKANDIVQQGQIEFKIAYEHKQLGQFPLAIQQLKAIISNPENTPILRAYAIQQIGMLWRDEGNVVRDEIFKDEPFRSLVVSGDDALTERRIFDWATQVFPTLAVSELYVANWYALQLELAKQGEVTLTDVETQNYLKRATDKFPLAEQNIQRMTQDEANMSELIPTALTLEASVKGTLAYLGYLSPDEARSAFDRALNYYAIQSSQSGDGYTRFQYARFLQKTYGKASAPDVQRILSPIYASPSYKNSDIMVYLAAERNNTHGRKHSIIKLAALDTKFKALLLSLGWTNSDFTQ